MARKRQTTIDPDLFAKTERPDQSAEPVTHPKGAFTLQQDSKTVGQQDVIPVSQPTTKGKRPSAVKTVQAAIKATYYLSPAALDAVDVTQAQLRRLAPAQRRALSKSKVVSAMILLASEHLQNSETASQFASKLVSQ